MDANDQLKQDVRAGRIDADRIVDMWASMGRQLQQANLRIAELEKQLGSAGTVKTAEPYSLRAEEQRQAARGNKPAPKHKPKRRGRITTADKIKLAERTEKVYPEGIAPEDCKLSHTRPLWQLENGRAVLLAYEVYRGPNNQYGKIPGSLGRSEFGSEFIIAIAYQVFIVGLSFDKVCLLMNFFQNLKLRKSQADALLNQLSKHWEKDFDRLCTLLANSAVVHTDETSWSIRSAWAFLSEKVRVVFFGVRKDAATLKEILDPATFAGIVVSDDAAIYANFTLSQKCWAHLLRKAFKLTLLDPLNSEYRTLADRLLEIYRSACRIQSDKRLSDTGRAKKVALLDDEILALCGPMYFADLPPLVGTDNDYRLLCNEVMKLMLDQQLFTFVTAAPVRQADGTAAPVAGTNNEAERTLRSVAEARKTGRTSKTLAGARRRTIVVSLLESLRPHLANFTLSSVIAEFRQWIDTGISRFEKLLNSLGVIPPTESILDRVLAPLSG
jgi:hypothetical protein